MAIDEVSRPEKIDREIENFNTSPIICESDRKIGVEFLKIAQLPLTEIPMQLTITDLTKTYSGEVRALDNISLTIPTGMFGLLGPNGAGKSTLMRTIATLQDADQGSIFLGDIDVLNNRAEVRRFLGYLPQEFGVYPRTSAVALLSHLACLKGVGDNARHRREIVDALLFRVNLFDVRHKSVATYSGGMRQRFGIAQALLGDPKLIIVDEPTAGLDPGERNRFYNLLSEVGESVVVILSTHIVEDVKELCQNMAIIHRGQVKFHGSPSSAESSMSGKVWSRSMSKQELRDLKGHSVLSTKLIEGRPVVRVFSEVDPGDGFVAAEPNLEDAFFFHIQ
ncbi:ABC transporter ATP-binding protein [Pirellulaceae bacterium SH449]